MFQTSFSQCFQNYDNDNDDVDDTLYTNQKFIFFKITTKYFQFFNEYCIPLLTISTTYWRQHQLQLKNLSEKKNTYNNYIIFISLFHFTGYV